MANKKINEPKYWLLCLIILSALDLIIFSQIFPSFFFADDFYYIFRNIASNPLDLLNKAIYLSFHDFFRPVFYIIFGINYAIFKLNYHGYYIVNLLFHFLNGALVYLFVSRAAWDKRIALLAAIIFTVFPGHWEAIGWLNPINHLTMVAAVITSLIFFDKHLKEGHIKDLFISALMYFIALTCHEGSLTLIMLIFLYIYIFGEKHRPKVGLGKMMPFVSVLGLYAVLNYATKYFLLTGPMKKQYVFGLHFVPNLLEYLSTLIIPVTIQYKLSALIPGPIFNSLMAAKYVLYVVIPISAIVLFIKGTKEVKFFTVWPFIVFLPFSFFTTPHTSRYLYLASIGYSALLAILIVRLYDNARTKLRKYFVVGLSGLLVLTYLGGMIAYQKVFYYKKDIRKRILMDFRKQIPELNKKDVYYFAGLPIREDEIKYMLYLWYGSSEAEIKLTENSDIKALMNQEHAVIFDYKNNRLVRVK